VGIHLLCSIATNEAFLLEKTDKKVYLLLTKKSCWKNLLTELFVCYEQKGNPAVILTIIIIKS